MPEDSSKGSAPEIRGYRMLRLLGEGGMGRVWLAQDELLGRTVAVKVVSEKFLDRPEARARFLREARSMATVEHPNVVRVYSFAETEAGAYLVMEYVEGETLSERLRRGRLGQDEALAILREVVDGLEAAWDKQLVHRDVKPGNVLLDKKGRAHVSDFGLAKPVASAGDTSLTDTGAILGTPFYVSPEQARGKPVDHRSDIYSVGIMAFEMLAGDPPFKGTTSFEVVAKHIHEPLPDVRVRRPDLPEALARVLEWMTAKDAAARPPSYAALRQALAAPSTATPAATSSATMTRLDTRESVAPAPRSWKRAAPAIAAAAVVLGLIGTSLWFERRPPAADPKQLVVAVAPFYGVDAASAAEGRTVAGLVEREVVRRLGSEGARVLGVDETRDPVRDHAAARALGERLGASVVVWGDANTASGQTEVQPSFTLVPRGEARAGASRAAVGRDPTEALREMAAARVAAPQSSSQIELRRTTAAGVGDLVLVLAGVHRLYVDGDAQKALALFERAPRSPESLRHRAIALSRLGRSDAALASLREALQLDPKDAQAHAALGDLLLEGDRLAEAGHELRAAAALGSSYATRNGIVFEDKLYVRETYLGQAGNQETVRLDSGYLLAVDPASGRVLERHRLPGVLDLRMSVHDVVLQFDFKEPLQASATFAKGRFEKPLFYSTYLLGRRRGVACGRTLAANFMSGDTWKVRPEHEQSALAPRTLAELEAELRRAIERDPTQPWLPLLLGQTLLAQGRADEAERTWAALFAGRFEATPYYEYCFMTRFFEALPQPRWADRAYAETLRRRRSLPQPIDETTLIERLINVPFLGEAAESARRGGDLRRAHLWLVRARELSGMTENDGLAAAAWEGYFRRKGDLEAANAERQFLERVFERPIQFERALPRFDLAALALLAAGAATFAMVLMLLSRERGAALPARLAAVTPRERNAVLVALALCVVAHVAATDARQNLLSLEQTPLGMMDGIANAESVLSLERRLAKRDTPASRIAAALANHMAGNLERARELYEPLGRHPRIVKNRDALASGARVPPEPMRAEDLLRAHAERTPFDWVPPRLLEIFGERGWGVVALTVLMSACRVGLLGLALLVAIGWTRVPPRADARRVAPGPRWAPGAAHLALRKPMLAYLTLLLLAFAAAVAIPQLLLRPSMPSLGPTSVEYQAGMRALPLPFPPGVRPSTDVELEQALRVFYWDFLRARPEVRAVWIAALLAGVAGVALESHARRRWARQLAEGNPLAQAPAIPETQPADARRSRPA
jgi:tetratricopeptide (TPR) repeat protein